jgi:hypothetical protein
MRMNGTATANEERTVFAPGYPANLLDWHVPTISCKPLLDELVLERQERHLLGSHLARSVSAVRADPELSPRMPGLVV